MTIRTACLVASIICTGMLATTSSTAGARVETTSWTAGWGRTPFGAVRGRTPSVFDEGDVSPVGAPDVVKDFSGSDGDGDKLDLSELTETEDGTALRVESQQFGQTGSSTAKTIVQVDLDGDGAIETGEDFQLELTRHHDLSAADFAF